MLFKITREGKAPTCYEVTGLRFDVHLFQDGLTVGSGRDEKAGYGRAVGCPIQLEVSFWVGFVFAAVVLLIVATKIYK